VFLDCYKDAVFERREILHLATKQRKSLNPLSDKKIKKVDGILSVFLSQDFKAEIILLEAQLNKTNQLSHEDYNKTAIMCKDSIDSILRNFRVNVPVHAINQNGIIQQEHQFTCYSLSRNFDQVYTYVQLFNLVTPKSLKEVNNLRDVLEIGIVMLAIKELAKETINIIEKAVNNPNQREIIIPTINPTPPTPLRGKQPQIKEEEEELSIKNTFSGSTPSTKQGEYSIVEFGIDKLTNQSVAKKKINTR